MGSADTNFQQEIPGAGPDARSGNGEAKQIMQEATEYSRTAAGRITEELKAQSRSIIDEQRERIARSLDILAEAMTDAVEKLREQHSESFADATETGARKVAHISGFLRENDPNRIVEQVEDFAKSQPALFIGAALAAGIVLGQLLSSPGKPRGSVRVLHPRNESSIEYKPAQDEEENYERH